MAHQFKNKSFSPRYKYKHNRKPADQDNKGYYAGWQGSSGWGTAEDPIYEHHCPSWIIRVPSLKRGRSTWKRFYKLFPHLKYRDSDAGVKLKKI
jgi:hypothetical protein